MLVVPFKFHVYTGYTFARAFNPHDLMLLPESFTNLDHFKHTKFNRKRQYGLAFC